MSNHLDAAVAIDIQLTPTADGTGSAPEPAPSQQHTLCAWHYVPGGSAIYLQCMLPRGYIKLCCDSHNLTFLLRRIFHARLIK